MTIEPILHKKTFRKLTTDELYELLRVRSEVFVVEQNCVYQDMDGDDQIIINSGFRSPEVNKAVGGVPTSNHTTGCAVDIRCIGIEQALRYAAILLDISDLNHEDFDELLIEQKGRVIWIHFAVRPFGNRRRTRST